MTLLSFHGKQEIKDFYIKRLEEHYNEDEFIKGKYWENGKGCAVGCTIHSDDHSLYEEKIGIPIWLAKLEDRIFEGLENKEAKEFPLHFIKSIPVGVELDKIKIPFLIFIVESALQSFDHIKFPKRKEKIENVLFILKNEPDNKEKLRNAYRNFNAAGCVDYDPYDPYEAAAYSGDSAVAAHAAGHAAAAAAYAAYATDSDSEGADAYAVCAAAYAAAAYAAYAADSDGYSAESAESAGYAAGKEKYKLFSNKLIELIKELK